MPSNEKNGRKKKMKTNLKRRMSVVLLLFLLVAVVTASERIDFKCTACKTLLNVLEIAIAGNATVDEVEHLFHKTICPLIARPTYFTLEVCRGIIHMYAPTTWPIILSGVVQPDVLCRLINVCGDDTNELDALRFDLLRLRDTLAPSHRRIVKRTASPPRAAGKALRILHVSDLHVDTMYITGGNSDCNTPLCCRSMDGANATNAASVWGEYSCDLTPTMFLSWQSAVANLQPPVDAVIITGDLTPHDIWNETAALQLARINAVNSALVSTFKGIAPVFMVLGNHDTVACDLFSTHAKDWLHHDDFRWLLDGIGSSWTLPPSALATLRQGGYYSAPIVPGLKLLAINTNGWNGNNVYMWLNDTKMTQMVQWFAQELASSEASGEKVVVAGHIQLRIASTDLLGTVTNDMLKLLTRFNRTIVGQMFGHTHHDEFQLVRPANSSFRAPAVGVQFVAPSLTTYTNINPSFRVFELDPNTFTFLDFEQYRANLDETIQNNGASWDVAYRATDAYGVPDLTPQSMQSLVDRFINNNTLFAMYVDNFQAGTAVHKVDKKKMICNMLGTTADDVANCK
jgi:sphingomyelin phosphodiesterase